MVSSPYQANHGFKPPLLGWLFLCLQFPQPIPTTNQWGQIPLILARRVEKSNGSDPIDIF
ncbi:hypothetical protein [Halioxenophilus aromaticivorans]|uniref:Uncharacterized protein n=1 Tax=Halioxenophilus aromaticivorans TaxID=1306992 RepID=A0AAV3U995_9ALTE